MFHKYKKTNPFDDDHDDDNHQTLSSSSGQQQHRQESNVRSSMLESALLQNNYSSTVHPSSSLPSMSSWSPNVLSSASNNDDMKSTNPFDEDYKKKRSSLDESVRSHYGLSDDYVFDISFHDEGGEGEDDETSVQAMKHRRRVKRSDFEDSSFGNNSNGRRRRYCSTSIDHEDDDSYSHRRVLTEILDHSKSIDHHHIHSHKMIYLEDLGTANSWIVLLMPYLSLLLALMIDSVVKHSSAFTSRINFDHLHLLDLNATNNAVEHNGWSNVENSLFHFNFMSNDDKEADMLVYQSSILLHDVDPLSSSVSMLLKFNESATRSDDDYGNTDVLEASFNIFQQENDDHTKNHEFDKKWKLVEHIPPFQLPLSFIINSKSSATITSEFDLPLGLFYGTELRVDFALHESSLVESHTVDLAVTYHNIGYSRLNIAIRLSLLTACCVFLLNWFWKLGYRGFFPSCRCFQSSRFFYDTSSDILENPWVVMPERRYLFFLIIGAILVINPLLGYLYFQQPLYANSRLRMLSDFIVNMGIFVMLFSWHNVIRSLKYHTADRTRKRYQRRKILGDLYDVASHVTQTADDVRDRIAEYLRTYGDVEGIFAQESSLYLKSDPNSEDWLDYIWLTFTFLLFSCALSFWFASLSHQDDVDNPLLFRLVQSSLDLCVFLWMVLIFINTCITADALSAQRFLATRAAQLAFRVLVSIQLLGAVAFIFIVLNTKPIYNISYAIQQAAGGPGVMLYSYISTATAAYIFSACDANDLELERQRDRSFVLDKRHIVTLARKTHTWRIFPLPILRMDEENAKRYHDSNNNSVLGLYMPVFCVETACWLMEASWNSYYNHSDNVNKYSHNSTKLKTVDQDQRSSAMGTQNLGALGLNLEHVVHCDKTDTWSYVCSNAHAQVDGNEDNIVVVIFRGTASITNVINDLKFRLVTLNECKCADIVTERPTITLSSDGTKCTAAADYEIDMTSSNAPYNAAAARIRVHEGFGRAYANIRKQLIKYVVQVYQRQYVKALKRWRLSKLRKGVRPYFSLPKIYLTGHSYGGSNAQLFALDLSNNFALYINPIVKRDVPSMNDSTAERVNEDFMGDLLSPNMLSTIDSYNDNYMSCAEFDEESLLRDKRELLFQPPIAVYTYGQTRVGNRAFAREYKRKVPHTFRICAEGDALTTQPVSGTGPLLSFIRFRSMWYKHAGLEVALDEGKTGNILVGPTIVETLFRFTKVRTNLEAHSLVRYRDCLEKALSERELEEYYEGHLENEEKAKRNNKRFGRFRKSSLLSSEVSGGLKKVPSWLTNIQR